MNKITLIIVILLPAFISCSKQTVNEPAGSQIYIEKQQGEGFDEKTKMERQLDDVLKKKSVMGKEESIYLLAMNNFINRHKDDKRIPKMIMKLGDYYFNQIRYSEAIEKYRLVIRNYKNSDVYVDAVKKIALTYARNGDFENAIAWYAKLKSASSIIQSKEHKSVSAGKLYREANMHEKSGDYKKAGVIYLGIAGRFPDYEIAAQSMMKAGIMMETTKDYKNANKIYQKFIKKFPNSPLLPEVVMREAGCWEKRGQYMTAAKKFINLVKFFPSSKQAEAAMYRAGIAFQNAGEVIVAARSFERYWELYPDGDNACSALKKARNIYKGQNNSEKKKTFETLLYKNCR